MILRRRGVGSTECDFYVNGVQNRARPWYCGPQELGADIYSWFQYGSTPNPSLAYPASPSTAAQMTQPGAFTPDDAAAGATPQQSAALTQQAISDAELAGSYTPLGAANKDTSTGVFLLIGAALVGFVAISLDRGRR